MDALKLELNGKTAIFPLKNGINFLGFHTYLDSGGKVIMKLRRVSHQGRGAVSSWPFRFWKYSRICARRRSSPTCIPFHTWDGGIQ